jgi:hypothetical protein
LKYGLCLWLLPLWVKLLSDRTTGELLESVPVRAACHYAV